MEISRDSLSREQATTLLLSAAKEGNLNDVQRALDAGADISANDHGALRSAAACGYTETVKLLLERGSVISADNHEALRFAARFGHTETVKLLLQRGADISANNHYALRFAARFGHTETVKLLLDNGADISAKNPEALRMAAAMGRTEIVKLLLDNGADIKANNHFALRSAAVCGYTEMVKLLLDNGADIKANNHEALRSAAEKGHTETVKLLLERGADISANNHEALRLAALNGHTETVALLLERGADISADNHYALREAAARGHTETAAFLTLATEILALSKSAQECFKFFRSLGITCPSSLKSDAFSSTGAVPHLASALLHAAHIATIFGAGDEELTRKAFVSLVTNDIQRVESATGLSYKKYSYHLSTRSAGITNFRDVITEVAECVTFPSLALRSSDADCEQLLKLARTKAAQLILNGKSSLDIPTLNHKWHRAGNRAPIELRPYKRIGEWYPLFSPLELSQGLTAECLTNPAALEQEGKILNHCVGGYTTACQSGKTHIISIRDNGVSLATIELGAGRDIKLPNGSQWRVKQIHGANNGTAPATALQAWSEAKERLSKGAGIPFATKLGLTDEAKQQTNIDEYERIAGFPLAEINTVLPKLLAHYRTRMLIQRGRSGAKVPLINEGAGSGDWSRLPLKRAGDYFARSHLKNGSVMRSSGFFRGKDAERSDATDESSRPQWNDF